MLISTLAKVVGGFAAGALLTGALMWNDTDKLNEVRGRANAEVEKANAEANQLNEDIKEILNLYKLN